jgi:hypothetical protein
MKTTIAIIYMFLLSFNLSASEPAPAKPTTLIGGGKVLGKARIVGMNGQAIIIKCDKSKEVCMYVLKKVSDDSGFDQCKTMQPWPVPPAAEQMFDQNYPYAFSFSTPTLKFYPAQQLTIGCPDANQAVDVTIHTAAAVELP